MLKKLSVNIFLVKRIPERHYWPLFIILSLYFVIPYSEFVVTLAALGYFKFEKSYRKVLPSLSLHFLMLLSVVDQSSSSL